MSNRSLPEFMEMPDPAFPVWVIEFEFGKAGPIFDSHWHDHLEFLIFERGRALIQCDKNRIEAGPGSIVVINSRDIHSGEGLSNDVKYTCIIIDISLLNSSFQDKCQTKYVTPLVQNQLLFKNIVQDDEKVFSCLNGILKEYYCNDQGRELYIKAFVFQLLGFLIRNHLDRILTPREYDCRIKNFERFKSIFDYIEENYTEKIEVQELAAIVNLSQFHLCRLFKEVTGKSLVDYLNSFRINKAEQLLKSTGLNITEVALSSGFNDVNYFSRLFKKYKKLSPSSVRK
jgi:AraC-like DNA-binding protein